VRLRDVAARRGATERSAHGTVADLTAAGYVVKRKHGHRNRYQIHLPLPEPASQEPAIGDVLTLLVSDSAAQKPRASAAGHEHADINDGDQAERPAISQTRGANLYVAGTGCGHRHQQRAAADGRRTCVPRPLRRHSEQRAPPAAGTRLRLAPKYAGAVSSV
jgi:hypothetical protein